MVHNMLMRLPPDKAGCRRRVSLLSRYGKWSLSLEEPSFSFVPESLAITFPRVSRDLLMCAPSARRSLFSAALSEPARSIRDKVETLTPPTAVPGLLASIDGEELGAPIMRSRLSTTI